MPVGFGGEFGGDFVLQQSGTFLHRHDLVIEAVETLRQPAAGQADAGLRGIFVRRRPAPEQ